MFSHFAQQTNANRAFFCHVCCRSPRGGVDRNIVLDIVTGIAKVAPHAGAWIEISVWPLRTVRWARRSPRGGVDRNEETAKKLLAPKVAPHAGAWIEISPIGVLVCPLYSRSPRGGVDRNEMVPYWQQYSPGRSPRGGVDRNSTRKAPAKPKPVAPHAGAWIEISILPGCCLLGLGRSPRGGVDRNH